MRATPLGTFLLGLALTAIVADAPRAEEEQEIKLSDCPAVVQRTLRAEAHGARIEAVTREKDDDGTTYWATVRIGGKNYAVDVAEDGTLNEVSLEVDDEETTLDRCPAAVQATFRREAKDAKIDTVDKDIKHGTMVYETVVTIGGHEYALVVAHDGTLVEKALVIEEDDVELTDCPAPVQEGLKEQVHGGKIGTITRSTGIGGHVYEAEVQIDGKDYVVELAENGTLIAKWLDEDDE